MIELLWYFFFIALIVAVFLQEYFYRKRAWKRLDEWEAQQEYMADQWQDRAKKLRKYK